MHHDRFPFKLHDYARSADFVASTQWHNDHLIRSKTIRLVASSHLGQALVINRMDLHMSYACAIFLAVKLHSHI